MGSTTIYYVPDARESDNYVFDGVYAYEAVRSLKGLDGRRKKRHKKRRGRFVKFFRRVGKGLKKVGKGVFKVVKKVIPIASTVLTFVPGVGWAAKAALTAAEIGINAAERRKKRRKLKKQQAGKSRSDQLRLSNQSTYQKSKQIDTYQANKYIASYDKNTIKSNVRTQVSPVSINVRPLIEAVNRQQKRDIKTILRLFDSEKANRIKANTVRDLTREQMRVSIQGRIPVNFNY